MVLDPPKTLKNEEQAHNFRPKTPFSWLQPEGPPVDFPEIASWHLTLLPEVPLIAVGHQDMSDPGTMRCKNLKTWRIIPLSKCSAIIVTSNYIYIYVYVCIYIYMYIYNIYIYIICDYVMMISWNRATRKSSILTGFSMKSTNPHFWKSPYGITMHSPLRGLTKLGVASF